MGETRIVRKGILGSVAAVATTLLLASPAAATVYLDDSGTDGANCGGAPNSPCETLTAAVATSELSFGETIEVGGGLYDEAVQTLGEASLVGANFNPPATNGEAIFHDAVGFEALLVANALATREVRNITVRGLQRGISVAGGVNPTNLTITDVNFEGDGDGEALTDARLWIDSGAGAAPLNLTIEDNEFTEPGAINYTIDRRGIRASVDDTAVLNAEIRDNVFDGYVQAMTVSGGGGADQIDVIGNTITRNYEGATAPRTIDYTNATGTISGNTLIADTTDSADGINISLSDGPAETVIADHNLVTGFDSQALNANSNNQPGDSVVISDSLFEADGFSATVGPVSLSNLNAGATLTNVTIANASIATESISKTGTPLTLNSSYLAQEIDATGDCTISFSRGPTLPPQANPCDAFQTNAAGGFVDEFAFLPDLHLAAASALIDAGDPAAPASASDLDGNPRALSGTPGCTLSPGRRDIGTYEFVPATGVGCPPPPTPPPTVNRQIDCKPGFRLKKVKSKSGKKRKKCVRKKKRRRR